ncbi:MAG: F0F1 ATP synthase subunit alpha [Chloroflexi bacterium]|nr:F0F1 ATP synthase subunit alpha [Chloroflexota bacterium]MBU1746057.1 F0F1 ATP synthase subunit alpha [Chloroflexota bacterium]MBU1879329.1 F0F1 ATP synthase subunit alpha [Chloroflexota bacterium]
MSDQPSIPDPHPLLQALRQRLGLTGGPGPASDPAAQRLRGLAAALPPVVRPHPQMARLLQLLDDQASRFTSQVRFREVGTVQHIGNGVANLSGLHRVRTDELVTFATGVQGLVLNLDRDRVDVIMLGPDQGIRGGDLVTATGHRLRVPVGPRLLGRVLNPLGEPLDEGRPIEAAAWHYLEREAPTIVERTPVHQPLHTGLKIVDALLPIGRGQRELIIGDRQTGKTALAVDAILNQHDTDVHCVYIAIGQKKSSTLAVIDTLRQARAMPYTTVVVSSSDDPPALRYLAPYAGCTIAEYLMHMGRDVLVVYDDLSKHADAYRELSLLLRRPPGREAYPGDIFYLHARLLERACKLNETAGGGSLTALPIVETQRGSIAAYIPTNLISITDGQIVLDAALFNRGVKPAIDVGRSVSRVGGAAQTPAMRAVAGKLRLELAQFEEVARFARFGTEVDEATQRQIQRGQRLQRVLTQPVHRPLALAVQVLTLWATAEGYLDDVPPPDVPAFERQLWAYFEAEQAGSLAQINRGGDLTDEIRHVWAEKMTGLSELWHAERNNVP